MICNKGHGLTHMCQIRTGLMANFYAVTLTTSAWTTTMKYVLSVEYVTQNEFDVLKEWHITLDKYKELNSDIYNPHVILGDPKWIDVVKKGTIAKANLSRMIKQEEINILTEEINAA